MTKITVTIDDNSKDKDEDDLFHYIKWTLLETSGENLTIEHIKKGKKPRPEKPAKSIKVW